MRVRSSTIFFVVILMFFSSCLSSNDSKENETSKENAETILFDSLFIYNDEQSLNIEKVAKDFKANIRYTALDSIERERFTEVIGSIKGVSPRYNAYYFSKQSKLPNSIMPIVIYLNYNNYSGLLLLTTNQDLTVDYIEVSTKEEALISQDDEKEVIWLKNKFSEQRGDKLKITTIEGEYSCFDGDTLYKLDTTVIDYSISSQGKIIKR